MTKDTVITPEERCVQWVFKWGNLLVQLILLITFYLTLHNMPPPMQPAVQFLGRADFGLNPEH